MYKLVVRSRWAVCGTFEGCLLQFKSRGHLSFPDSAVTMAKLMNRIFRSLFINGADLSLPFDHPIPLQFNRMHISYHRSCKLCMLQAQMRTFYSPGRKCSPPHLAALDRNDRMPSEMSTPCTCSYHLCIFSFTGIVQQMFVAWVPEIQNHSEEAQQDVRINQHFQLHSNKGMVHTGLDSCCSNLKPE